jgi:hypothetical protein
MRESYADIDIRVNILISRIKNQEYLTHSIHVRNDIETAPHSFKYCAPSLLLSMQIPDQHFSF